MTQLLSDPTLSASGKGLLHVKCCQKTDVRSDLVVFDAGRKKKRKGGGGLNAMSPVKV